MGKTALITGASSGSAKLSHGNWPLRVQSGHYARRSGRLQKLSDELEEKYGIKVHALGFDIRERIQTESAIEALPRISARSTS
ncbi:MAG: hypothetical protein ACLR76_03630 [Alistipes sp.]